MRWDFRLLATPHVERSEGGNLGWGKTATSRNHKPPNVLGIAEFAWMVCYIYSVMDAAWYSADPVR